VLAAQLTVGHFVLLAGAGIASTPLRRASPAGLVAIV
jgi:hypothetical protein